MSVFVDDDLTLMSNQLSKYNGLVKIDSGTGTHFKLKLKPRSVYTRNAYSYTE